MSSNPSGTELYKLTKSERPWGQVLNIDDPDMLCLAYTVMPLRSITVALFPVWKWDRGQLLFKAKEIEYASCKTEN